MEKGGLPIFERPCKINPKYECHRRVFPELSKKLSKLNLKIVPHFICTILLSNYKKCVGNYGNDGNFGNNGNDGNDGDYEKDGKDDTDDFSCDFAKKI